MTILFSFFFEDISSFSTSYQLNSLFTRCLRNGCDGNGSKTCQYFNSKRQCKNVNTCRFTLEEVMSGINKLNNPYRKPNKNGALLSAYAMAWNNGRLGPINTTEICRCYTKCMII